MGYGSTSHMTLNKERKVVKFNRRIVKHRRHIDQHQQLHKHKAHAGYKRHFHKRSPCQQYTINFSPQYKPASPIITMRPLSYSDQYKPQMLTFQQETNNENYSGYIDSLMLLKMQRQEQRSLQLIQQLGNITFEDGSVRGGEFVAQK